MDLTKLHLHWRISHYKGKSYRSYSLAHAYRNNDGKNRRKIFIKLGKLSDAEAEKWHSFLKAIKKTNVFLATLDDIVVTNHYAYLDVNTASAIWDEWELDNIFRENDRKDLGSEIIARVLTVNRCIEPASKSQTPEWFRDTALPWLLDITPNVVNTSRIFRELAVIENHKEAICKHLFTRIMDDNPDSMKSVFYDLSSTTFTGSRCTLMKWGHCKEGYHNHVVLALVVNREGLPFYWEVLPGNTADSETIAWLIERLKKHFGVINTTLVFDRGMVSNDNLTLIEKDNIKYISAMDKSQLETHTAIDFTSFSFLDPEHIDQQVGELSNFTKLNNDIYYREVNVVGKRRYILCFNPRLFKDQRKARKQTVADFCKFVDDLNAELSTAKSSRQRKPTYNKFKRKIIKIKLNSFVDVKLRIKHIKRTDSKSIRTYQATIVIDDVAMHQTEKLDGFWLLVTNHVEEIKDGFAVSAKEAITPYRDKVVIESAFRDIKSFVEVEPVYVWTETHVKAHYTICVLSYLINRILTLRLHENKGSTTKEIVSHEKLYKKLSGCQIDHLDVKNVGLSTYNVTSLTNEQKELLKRIGLMDLPSSEVVKKARANVYN